MLSRRDVSLGVATAAAAMALAQPAVAAARFGAGRRVEGPVAGGRRGHVFGGYFGDGLAAAGYVEEEYFVSGAARNFKALGPLGADGRWKTAPDRTAPFKTRVVVHRPKDPSKFNGLLICDWTNVSSGREISNAVNESYYKSGYAYAAISAQPVGLEGVPPGAGDGIRTWDPDRYGPLHVPGDSFSYSIFTEVARALASPNGRSGPDPLGGLKVRRCIATGASQSAARIAGYINAAHAHERFFAAFVPSVLVGGATNLQDLAVEPGQSLAAFNDRRRAQVEACVIRDDLTTPILIILSETEARGFRVPPQPDSAWVRVWELAGAVHGSSSDTGYRPDVSERDGIRDAFQGSRAKMVPFMPTIAAAGLALDRWLAGGAALARHPRLLRAADGRTLELDAQGNALGGVRLPEIEAPTAVFATDARSPGRTRLPEDRLRQLYPTDAAYLAAVRAAVGRCEVQDLILPYRAAEYLAAARRGPLAQD